MTIPPLGQYTWTLALPAWFAAQNQTMPGVYRLAWDYEGTRSEAIPLLLAGDAAPEEAARAMPRPAGLTLDMLPIVDAPEPALFFLLANGSGRAVPFTGLTTGWRSVTGGPDGSVTDLPTDLLVNATTLILEGADVAPGQLRMRILPLARLCELLPAPGTHTLVWTLREPEGQPPVESRLMVVREK